MPPDQTPPKPTTPGGDLFATVYQNLRAIAQRRMSGERGSHTLQATALVNEVYLRLQKEGVLSRAQGDAVGGAGQFYATAARAMRQILVEHARSRGRQKRGGGINVVDLNVLDLAAQEKNDEILALDEALCRLEQRSAKAASVVQYRFYAGLTIDETAEAMGISSRSVDEAWSFARAFLWRELNPPSETE